MVELTDKQLARYARQLILPEIDLEGQQRLQQGRVLVVGAGGLGGPISQYLAAAGVGTPIYLIYAIWEAAGHVRRNR